MFGDISAWFYQTLAGIRPDPAGPGFKKIIIRPTPVGDVVSAAAGYVSGYGPIESAWRKTDEQFVLEVTIPPNTSACPCGRSRR